MTTGIIIAGGIGSRIGNNVPKQFIKVLNKPIIVYTIEAILKSQRITSVIVVCHPKWIEEMNKIVFEYNLSDVVKVVSGGRTGFESTYFGIVEAKEDKNCSEVLIHDGNRPLVTEDILSRAFDTFDRYGNAVVAIPCVEVTYLSTDHQTFCQYLNRDEVIKTQMPQIYKLSEILPLYDEKIKQGKIDYLSTTELLFKEGRPLYYSRGSESNIKITYPEDLIMFEAMVRFNSL